MKSVGEKAKYSKPMVLDHRPVRFETAHSWNPGVGNHPDSSGNNGINWPNSNPNPTPGGAGAPGNGNGKK